MSNRPSVYVLTTAGGDASVIRILDRGRTIYIYQQDGRALLDRYASYGVKDAGFLVLEEERFVFSDGGFSVDAVLAAAACLARVSNKSAVSFKLGSLDQPTRSQIEWTNDGLARVSSGFCNLPIVAFSARPRLPQGWTSELIVAEIAGTVLVFVAEDFRDLGQRLESVHRSIRDNLLLGGYREVSICWYRKDDRGIRVDPVVWDRRIGQLRHCQSCGTASIVAAKLFSTRTIIQPSGLEIHVVGGDSLVVESPVRLITTA